MRFLKKMIAESSAGEPAGSSTKSATESAAPTTFDPVELHEFAERMLIEGHGGEILQYALVVGLIIVMAISAMSVCLRLH